MELGAWVLKPKVWVRFYRNIKAAVSPSIDEIKTRPVHRIAVQAWCVL